MGEIDQSWAERDRQHSWHGSSPTPVRVFGVTEVGDPEAPLGLGSPKQKAVLAMLVLEAGEVVPTDRLIEMLWDGRPPRTASHSVQIYVSELRKVFAGHTWAPVIETRETGYRLIIDRDLVDVHRFAGLVRSGLGSVADGDALEAVPALRAALRLWRGDPLGDFTYAEFARPHVRRLTDLRRDALEALAAAELEAGALGDAMRDVRLLLAEDPLRERGVELLILTLYRSGRHVQALRVYDQHRRDLAEELGVVPSPRLDQLNEQILLHDPSLTPASRSIAVVHEPARNPYKGLRPFREEDADDFFGRDDLVDRMVELLKEGRRLVALVGPSGSGKSSVVAAGLLPRLHAGVLDGSSEWLIASMIPDADPLRQANAIIARVAGSTPPPSVERTQPSAPSGATEPSSLHAVGGSARVLLVVDQFEEVFLSADQLSAQRFLDALAASLTDAAGHMTVVLTLRADLYDRPLSSAAFAGVFTSGVVNVLPMSAKELSAAVVAPAERAGLSVQPELVAELVGDTIHQPGSLPLLQHALSEQFDRTIGDRLLLDDYAALGGLRGLVSRSADQVFDSLDTDEQLVAQRVFLRMVRVGRGTADACRRLPVSELTELDLDPVALSNVLSAFGRHRLLLFDADQLTGRATVGIAHEALLDEWDRLKAWIERHRTTLDRYEGLRTAAAEWEKVGRLVDYLLTGVRLSEVATWPAADATPGLTLTERAFIEASTAHERMQRVEEMARELADQRLARRSRRRLIGLVGATAALIGVATFAILAVGTEGDGVDRVTLFYQPSGEVGGLIASGFDRGVTEFGPSSQKIDAVEVDNPALLDEVSANQDLVVAFTSETDVDAVAARHPSTNFVVLDRSSSAPNVTSLSFGVNEGSYLVGAAAALTSTTGTIGFIGGVDIDTIWQFQAGYEAGARMIDPTVEILTAYLSQPPDYDGFLNTDEGRRAADEMYGAGADVVFAAAGASGLGVFEAAVDGSTASRHLWAIGVDSDQYETVAELPGSVGAAVWPQHILTSMVKHYDIAVYEVLKEQAEGDELPPDMRFGLVDGGVDISYSGGHLVEARPELERLRAAIVSGEIHVPCRPPDHLDRVATEPSTCVG